MRPPRTERGPDHSSQTTTVLVVSASMGAGHDGAARELRRRLERRGDTVDLVDFLDLMPLRFGRVLRASYRLQLPRRAVELRARVPPARERVLVSCGLRSSRS